LNKRAEFAPPVFGIKAKPNRRREAAANLSNFNAPAEILVCLFRQQLPAAGLIFLIPS
jgi:hypothetical protein